MLKRIIAVLATATLAIGLALGAAMPASAHTGDLPVTAVCNPATGMYDLTAKLNISNAGSTAGVTSWRVGTATFQGTPTDASGMTSTITITGNGSYVLTTFSLPGDTKGNGPWVYAHTTFTNKVTLGSDGQLKTSLTGNCKGPASDTGLTCDVSTLYKGSALVNGDHINMNVVYPAGNGGKSDVFQVNASVDKAQTPPQDPASESGLVVRIKLPTGNVTLPLTNAQVKSGILAFEYSKGWTGSYSVQWVQYNSMYFNQDNLRKNDLNCGKDTPVAVKNVPSATTPTCSADGSLVLPANDNITWTGGTNGAGPGTYTVTAVPAKGYTLNGAQGTWTIVVKSKSDVTQCTVSIKPAVQVATCDADGKVKSATITVTKNDNLRYTIGTTVLVQGAPLPYQAGTYTVKVEALNGYTNTGASSYQVSIAAFDCNKATKPTLTVAQCDVTTGLPTSAFITIPATTPGLEYTIAGVNAGQPLSGNVSLGAGTYTVNVAPKAGYTNTGPASFTIIVAALTCEKAVTPTLTVSYCQPTTGSFQSAYITIPTTTPGVTYSISTILDGQALSGTVNLPAGTYTVNVTEKSGYTNTGPSSFTIVVPALDCEKAVAPTLTVAQCDATTGALTSAYIKVPTTTPGLNYTITGVNNGQPLSGNVNLPAGTHTVLVTEKAGVKNTGPTSFTIVIAALTCEKALEPALTIAECDADGDVVSASLTATTLTPGLTYTIRGGAVLKPGVATPVVAGTYVVDVTASSGVKNTGPTSFTIKIDDFDCNESVEPDLTIAECNVLTGPKSAFLTIPTTTPGLIYSIGGKDYVAGDTVNLPTGPYTVDVRAAAGFTNTGKSSFSGTVPAVDCDGENYVQPTVTPQSCDTVLGGTKDGTLLFTLNPFVAYTLDGTPVKTALVSNVAPGAHTIKVTPAAGHYIKGGIDTFTVTVNPAVGCDNVYTTPLDPFADPEVCDPLSTSKLDGSITIVHMAGVQWYIGSKADGTDKIAVGDPTTVGNVTYDYKAGNYFVFAESKDPTISIKPGHTVFPLTIDFPSDLCTLGFFDPSATAKSAVCNATGDNRGTITVDLMPGVTYAFQGGPTITSVTTLVAPGTYTVVATPDDPRSALSQNKWVLAVSAPALLLCDLETLAFTGQDITGYLVIAIILLQLGLAFVAVQFIRARRKARHLAV